MARKRSAYPNWDDHKEQAPGQRGPKEPAPPEFQCRTCHRRDPGLVCCSICRSWLCHRHQRSWDHACREWYLLKAHPETGEEWQRKYDRYDYKRRRF